MQQRELSLFRSACECLAVMAPVGALAQQTELQLDLLGKKRLVSLAAFALH